MRHVRALSQKIKRAEQVSPSVWVDFVIGILTALGTVFETKEALETAT